MSNAKSLNFFVENLSSTHSFFEFNNRTLRNNVKTFFNELYLLPKN
jgi:hypothetical protein